MAESGNQQSNGAENTDDDDTLQQLQAEEDELAKRVEAEVSEELNLHLAKLELELKLAFDERMSAIQQQCTTQAKQEIDTRQTDILRTNKVFRDVSRALGTNWRPVYDVLMSRFPPDVQSSERAKIEVERPILQAYKALNTWKDVCGADFEVRQLVDALRQNGLGELVAMALQILDSSEKDSLITFAGFGNPSKSSSQGSVHATTASSSRLTGSDLRASTASRPAAAAPGSGGDASSVSVPNISAEDALDDRHILQVAKRLGADWEQVARKLSVPKSEIDEILASEGHTYQGAFKMLWGWCEVASNLSQSFGNLMVVLAELGRQDIIDLLRH